jgi:transposase
MAKRGRKPTQVDDPKVKLLLQALQAGNYVEVSCAYAGLSVATIYQWMDKGRKEKEHIANGGTPHSDQSSYVEILEAIESARAKAIVANVAVIQQAARSGTWQAAAWWLERTNPQQFGRRIQAEVTGRISVDDLERRMLELISDDSSDVQAIES